MCLRGQLDSCVIIVVMVSITDYTASKSLENKKQGPCEIVDSRWNITELMKKAEEYKAKTQYRYASYFDFDPFHPTRFCTNRVFRVRGGQDVEIGTMPWIVYITSIYSLFQVTNCTGVVISYNWILTAAHCLNFDPRPMVFTHLGFYRMSHIDDIAFLDISFDDQLYIHPDYNSTSHTADLALLRVNISGSASYPIRPMCLPLTSDDLNANQSCTAAGWGLTHRATMTKAERMQKMEVFHDRTEGDKIYVKASPTAPNATGTCLGDSGGPLVCRIGNTNTVVGILSLSPYFCDNRRYPSTYIRVRPYLDWIRDVVTTRGDKRRK